MYLYISFMLLTLLINQLYSTYLVTCHGYDTSVKNISRDWLQNAANNYIFGLHTYNNNNNKNHNCRPK